MKVPEADFFLAVEVLSSNPEMDHEELVGKLVTNGMDELLADRLVHWVPEGFALSAIERMGKIIFLGGFSARTAEGKWKHFPLAKEPIFGMSLACGRNTFVAGDPSPEVHKTISSRSAMLNSVNNALSDGKSLDGARMAGPALIGLSAELYGYKSALSRIKHIFRITSQER